MVQAVIINKTVYQRELMRFLLLILLSSTLLFADNGAEDLLYMTEDYPPYNYLDEYGILQGSSVEIVKVLWHEMKIPEQKIRLLPWARAYYNIQSQKKQVLFTMSRTEEREALFKWVGPISSSRHLLVGYSKDSSKIVINSTKDILTYNIGVVRLDVGEQVLIKHNIPKSNMKEVIKMKDNIASLLNGDVDLISIGEEAFTSLKKLDGVGENIYIAYTMGVSQDYIAFSKDIPDSTIEKFRKALDAIEIEHRNILNKYDLKVVKE